MDSNTERKVIEDYFKEISIFNLITPSEEVEIYQNIIKGKYKPRLRLIEGNFRLVYSVAKKYKNSGLEIMDLINEGNMGLVKAAQIFDPTKGKRFKTFAIRFIHKAIEEAIKIRK